MTMVFLNHEAQLLRLAELRHRATAERARRAGERPGALDDRPGRGARWGRAKPTERARESTGPDDRTEGTGGPDPGSPVGSLGSLWSRRYNRSRRRRGWSKAV